VPPSAGSVSWVPVTTPGTDGRPTLGSYLILVNVQDVPPAVRRWTSLRSCGGTLASSTPGVLLVPLPATTPVLEPATGPVSTTS
jgi:hypothetical protein